MARGSSELGDVTKRFNFMKGTLVRALSNTAHCKTVVRDTGFRVQDNSNAAQAVMKLRRAEQLITEASELINECKIDKDLYQSADK